MKKPLIIAISGVSGSGKDSVLERLWQSPEIYDIVVSYTDRPKRPGEIEDKNYHYISKEEFDSAITKNEFIEWETVRGEYRFGRKKREIEKGIASQKIVVLSVDVLGMAKFKKIFENLVSIFIMPPSIEEAMKRLKKRQTEDPAEIEERIKRYSLELSYKDKYDHIVINDDLKQAQDEVENIIKKEKDQLQKKTWQIRLALFIFGLAILGLGVGTAYAYHYLAQKTAKLSVSDDPSAPKIVDVAETVAPVATVPPVEVQQKIASNPPTTTKSSGKTTTTKNSDGSKTTTFSTAGGAGTTALTQLDRSVSPQTALQVPIIDETGKYGDLSSILLNYLNSTLRSRNEISAMKGIIIENAGASGWNGQYLGSYTVSGSNKITMAEGEIILNTYYIEADYCAGSKNFSGCDAEYAKLFLSHEYGHHYTLYHKWLDWNLPSGVRFPDSYYETRPLSKATTTTDYSKGWSNCEAEIIAEDYSYLYSGYRQNAMAQTYGYPSLATKTWLDNIGSASELNNTVTNTPPTITITAPVPNSTLTGTVNFSANATDDIAVSSVVFYVDDKLVSTDQTAPYSTSINTTAFANGSHALKTVASDGTLTTTSTINVNFSNTLTDLEPPAIAITNPTSSPFVLTIDPFTISVRANDNIGVDHIDLFLDDQFQQSWKTKNLNLSVSLSTLPAGTYRLRFVVHDAAGNSNEQVLSVVKQ